MSAPERLRPPNLGHVASCPVGTEAGIVVDLRALDRLMPMHVVIDSAGRIVKAARTLHRMRPGQQLDAAKIFDVFEICRPRNASTVRDLLAVDGGRLSLAFREDAHGRFKAVIVPLCGGAPSTTCPSAFPSLMRCVHTTSRRAISRTRISRSRCCISSKRNPPHCTNPESSICDWRLPRLPRKNRPSPTL